MTDKPKLPPIPNPTVHPGANPDPRTTLTDRTQVYPEHTTRITDPSHPRFGQQQDYVVLAEEELAKGYKRPFRNAYIHLTCGTLTVMGDTLSATYARDPSFYGATFCAGCRDHFPVGPAPRGQFVWDKPFPNAPLGKQSYVGT